MGLPGMSSGEYATARGIICPFCRSSNIEPGSGDDSIKAIGAGQVEWEVGCLECEERWVEIYWLDGFRLKTDEKVEVE